MAVLVYAENHGGKFKKGALEAATYGHDLAQALGLPCVAVSVGAVPDGELAVLGQYGVSKVYNVNSSALASFNDAAYANAIAQAAQAAGASVVVLGQTYNCKAAAPRVAVRLQAGLLSGVTSLAQKAGTGLSARRVCYTSKGIEELCSTTAKTVITVKSNGYKVKENVVNASIENLAYTAGPADGLMVVKETKKASDKISLTEADVVVSAGRGVGNEQNYGENWKHIGELADLLGAATACSKPIGDLHLRPHHEHVGQTGVQISPNVYIAVGISGAIQHLAGVSSSKTIIVINKDPEAPFFKAADYGIVGDYLDVVPRLVAAVKAFKAKHA